MAFSAPGCDYFTPEEKQDFGLKILAIQLHTQQAAADIMNVRPMG
jgi:hypothetical protein